MKQVTILFVVTEDWYFFSHRLPLAVAAKERGFNVVLAARFTSHELEIQRLGIQTVPLKWLNRSSMSLLRELVTFLEILSVYRKVRPSLVHHVALKPVIYGSMAARLLGIHARVNALGGLGFVFTSDRSLALILRPLVTSIFRFIFNDKYGQLILQNTDDFFLVEKKMGVNKKYMRLIRSAGVDTNQYRERSLPEGIPIAMFASRMLWDKGVGEFVLAAEILLKQGVTCRFVLVGNPDTENPNSVSMDQLNKWKHSGVIEWWGHCNDMPSTLSQASVVCLPSYYGEGIPKVLIEAMSCARPIITTNMPGCRELVPSNKNGLLVQPRDPVSLSNALALVLSSKSLRQEMGGEGRKIAEAEYSIVRVIRETFNLYEYLLRK